MTNDNKLRTHIAGLLNALSERLPNDQLLRQRTAHLKKPAAGESLAARKRRIEEYKTIVEETVADMYHRIDLHSSAILKLTSDENITGPVRTLAHLTKTEIADVRDLMSEVESASNPGDGLMIVMKMIGAGLRGLPREQQIEAATAQLENYSSAA